MRRRRREMEPMTEMNVTNLLDTVFVLLMAFMVVAPAMKHGIELDLPQVAGESIDTKKTLAVIIRPQTLAGGSDLIYVEDKRVSLDELSTMLVDQKKQYRDLDVTMEIDKAVPFDTVARSLGVINASGIEKVGFITEPPGPGESAPAATASTAPAKTPVKVKKP